MDASGVWRLSVMNPALPVGFATLCGTESLPSSRLATM